MGGEAVLEVGVASCGGGVGDGVAEGFLFADQYAHARGAADSGVEEIAVEHRFVGHCQRKYHVLYFGAL